MSAVLPRRARLWHVPQMTLILWEFARRTPWLPRVRPYHIDLYVMATLTRRGWVRVLHDARGPVAFIARNGTWILALYVHPRAQRRGLGRVLLNDAKRAEAQLNLHVVELNHAARAFYAGQGFVEYARGRGLGNDENLDDIHMIWQADGSSEI